MTLLQLVESDYKKAKINYLRAAARKGTDIVELTNLEEIKVLRRKIVQIVKEKEQCQDLEKSAR